MHDDAPRYEPPALIELGSVAELTHGQSDGRRLDMTYIVGTDRGELTFS